MKGLNWFYSKQRTKSDTNPLPVTRAAKNKNANPDRLLRESGGSDLAQGQGLAVFA